MSATSTMNMESLLSARVSVPSHVVHRAFARETVMLNLQTGQYHGLNGAGGKMLEALVQAPTVRDGVKALERHFNASHDQLEQDSCEFCIDLASRGLIEISYGAARG